MQSLVTQRRLTVQAEETRALGARLGRWARAGDIVACRGALGAGKTTFVQGFAEGLDVGRELCAESNVCLSPCVSWPYSFVSFRFL